MNRHRGLPHAAPHHRTDRFVAQGHFSRGYIDGLILSNDGTDATNDIGISAGVCRSTVSIVDGSPSTLARDQIDMEIPVAIIKQLDVAWAPDNYDTAGYSNGGRSGGRSASSLSDTTWPVYVIGKRSEKPDVLLHDSMTQSSVLAALPRGYTSYRYIGSILRESSAIVSFTQRADYFERKTMAADVSNTNPGTSAVTRTLSVPVGVVVEADVIFATVQVAAGTATHGLISSLSSTDETPAIGLSHNTYVAQSAGFSTGAAAAVRVWTNTAAQVRTRVSYSDANVITYVKTRGWTDLRGRGA